MVTKLSAVAGGLGILTDGSLLQALDIDRDIELEVTTDGQRLILAPVRPVRESALDVAAERMMSRHDATLRKLAQ